MKYIKLFEDRIDLYDEIHEIFDIFQEFADEYHMEYRDDLENRENSGVPAPLNQLFYCLKPYGVDEIVLTVWFEYPYDPELYESCYQKFLKNAKPEFIKKLNNFGYGGTGGIQYYFTSIGYKFSIKI